MALNIKDPTVERLATEAARMTGESKTGAIRTALQERVEKLSRRQAVGTRKGRLLRFLEEEAWPAVPKGVLGRRVSKREREAILGYGPEGV
jgi:antitoxin VapB